MHAMLFVAWFSTHEVKLGNAGAESVSHSIDIQLLAQANIKPANRPVTSSQKAATSKPAEKDLTQPIRQKTTNTHSAQQDNNVITPSDQAAEAKTEKFYTLLHTAINKQKYYPVSALRMQQQGTVRISFRLFNNGDLEEVEVSQSSGYHSLDNAALLAVKSIQPFHPAAEYIASVENFQLDIIFQL